MSARPAVSQSRQACGVSRRVRECFNSSTGRSSSRSTSPRRSARSTAALARAPAFAYVPVAVHGGLAWVSGQLPWVGDELMAKGRLGAEIEVRIPSK